MHGSEALAQADEAVGDRSLVKDASDPMRSGVLEGVCPWLCQGLVEYGDSCMAMLD